jgi:hypothetical protein
MNTNCTLSRIIAGALLTGGAAVAGLGLAGTAQADDVYTWCPGNVAYLPRKTCKNLRNCPAA